MSDSQGRPGGVTYREPGAEYFDKRGLKRHARVGSLWALGVGAVISGQFSGWNLGLAVGGWGGMFVAALIISLMYLGLCFSLAELSPALPHTGGAYSFARSTLGPFGAFVTGLAESIEYIMTPAVIVFYVGTYLNAIFETPASVAPLWWVACYVLFSALNYVGVEVSFKVSVVVTSLALLTLAFFCVSAWPVSDFSRWALNIAADGGGSLRELPGGGGQFLPFGLGGAFAALPFAVWLYLGIEELPLAAEESHAPERDMPKALLLGMLTLLVFALSVLFFNAAIGGDRPGQLRGAFSLATSSEPLLDGFRTLYGTSAARLLSLCAVIGLIASFHTIIFAYSRQIYSLARAGYYPPLLSLTHGVRKTPYAALVAGSGAGLAVLVAVWLARGPEQGGVVIGGSLLNMAVFGAMISYTFQGVSFIVLRVKQPQLPRPYRSPLGIPGALLTIVIALWTMTYQLRDPAYVQGVYGALVWYTLGIAYYLLIGRHRLVLSPEEQAALATER
ncbi:MAG: amino acid permease [Polyangiales bacterium]